jgi:hypothetical protein
MDPDGLTAMEWRNQGTMQTLEGTKKRIGRKSSILVVGGVGQLLQIMMVFSHLEHADLKGIG